MRAAPFFPRQEMSTTYAMSVDDTSLYFDLSALTPKQAKDDEESRDLMGFLQVVLIGLGKPSDHVALYDAFGAPPWPDRLARYTDFFERMGIDPIPPQHRHLHPKDDFYPSIARDLPTTESITLYMTSGTNSVLHNDPEALRISRNVNSKFHFAATAPGFGIPVPDTLVTTKGQLESAEVRAFMAAHGPRVMLKISGLAGARNVTVVDTVEAARHYVSEFANDMPVLLQRRCDFSRYTEMTADLRISDRDITIANVRRILFADGLWVGNLIGADVVATDAHRKVLLQVGEYARQQGFVRPEGINCGVDYFVAGDEVLVTEINARWTGGLFPTEMMRRVGADDETAIAFVDMVRADKFERYLRFIDGSLYKESEAPFAMIPLGASPIPQLVNGIESYLSWQIVTGDFEAFRQARRDQLGDGALARAESIRLELGS